MSAAPAEALLRPIQIDHMTIDPPLFLAPMAGQTNHAFRTLCRDMGGVGMVCTELLSSVPLQYPKAVRHSMRLFDWTDDEIPFAVQLFGADPYVMAEAARVVVDHGAAIVDINMGCWVPKIVKTGSGAALLRDICSATAVVEAVVNAVSVPVTVKVRAGFDDGVITAVPFAKSARDVGARLIAVHARFAKQGFTGTANWDIIRQVKEAVPDMPVIGNGDVQNAADARRMLETTGCDGVMIGRAALGNPWIFQQIAHELRTGEAPTLPSGRERAEACLTQAYRTLETTKLHPRQAILELRGQLCKYVTGLHEAARIRDLLVRADSIEAIESALAPLLT